MFNQSTQNQMSDKFDQNNREIILSNNRANKSISVNHMQKERTYSNDCIKANNIQYSEYRENADEMVIQKSEASNDQPIQIQNENVNRDVSMLNHEIIQSKNEDENKSKLSLDYPKLNKETFETYEEWINYKDEDEKSKVIYRVMIENLNKKSQIWMNIYLHWIQLCVIRVDMWLNWRNAQLIRVMT